MNPVSQFLNFVGEKLTKHIVYFSLSALVFIVAVTFGITKLELVGSVGNIFDPKSQYVMEFEDFAVDYGSLEREIIIVIENDDILDETVRNEISNLHLELEFLDNVSTVVSIASLRDAPGKVNGLGQLMADENFEKYGKQAILEKLYEHPIARHRLISKDATKTMILLGLKPINERDSTLKQINALARSLAENELKSSQFYFTGFLAVSAEIVEAILRDQIIFVAGGAVLGFIFGYLFFRHFTLVMATAVPAILSIILSLGAMGWVGISVNVMTNVVPTIIMVIAFADSMHMVDAVRGRLELGDTPKQAVIYAMRVIGPACLFTSLTTSVAFLSLSFAQTPIVAQFGQAAAMGTFLALFTSLLLSCIICLTLGRFFPVKVKVSKAPNNGILHYKMSEFSRFMGRLSIRHAKKIIFVGSGLLLIATYVHFLNQPQYRYSEILPSNNPAAHAIQIVDKNLGGIDSFYYVITRKDGAAIDFEAAGLMPMLTELDELIATTDLHSSHSSIIQILKWLEADVDGATVEDILQTLPAEFSSRFVSPARKSVVITAFSADLGAAKLRPFLRDMRMKTAKIIAKTPEYNLMITGLAAMSAEESFSMIGELNSGLLIAMVIIILLMGIVFKSVFYAFASILPNLLPIVAGGALLYFIGDGLQFTTVIALTIAFGIAVDDSIHFLYQYRQNIKIYDAETAIDMTLKRVGPVLIATTFMLSAGLGLMFLSELPQMQLFGIVIIFILNVALLADIAILPSIFYIKDKKKH